MSTEQNKALARELVEQVFNLGNVSRIDDLLVPDFVEHSDLPGGSPGREGLKQWTHALLSAFPDLQVTVDDIIAEGDKVVMRETWSGTQKGEFLGVPPTGKRVSFALIDIIRIAGNKAAEHWGQADIMGLMQQLGVIPAPG